MEHGLTQEAPQRPWFPSGERIAFYLILAGTLYAAYITIHPVLLIVVLAAAVASLTFRLFERMVIVARGRRRLGAILAASIVLIGVFGPLATVGVLAVQRLVVEIADLATRLKSDGSGSIANLTRHLGRIGPPVARTIEGVTPRIADAAPVIAQRIAQVIAAIGSAVAQIGIALFLMIIALYYFYLNGIAWRERLVRLSPLPPEMMHAFLSRFHQVSVGVIVGSLGSALVQGTLATVGYLFLHVQVPLIWGLATAVAALIPPLGSAVIWIPLSVATGFREGWWHGVLLALYGGVIVGMVDNLLRPVITRYGFRIHPLFIFIAIFGGFASYGLAGLFLGPLAMALAITVLDLYEGQLERGKGTGSEPN